MTVLKRKLCGVCMTGERRLIGQAGGYFFPFWDDCHCCRDRILESNSKEALLPRADGVIKFNKVLKLN